MLPCVKAPKYVSDVHATNGPLHVEYTHNPGVQQVISQHFRDLPTKLQERIAANSVLRIHYKQQYMEQLPVVVYDWKGILHVEKKALQLLTEEADDYEVAGRLLQAHTC